MSELISNFRPDNDIAQCPEIQSMLSTLQEKYGGEFFPWGVRLLDLTREGAIQQETLFQIAGEISGCDGHKQVEKFFTRLEKTMAMRQEHIVYQH